MYNWICSLFILFSVVFIGYGQHELRFQNFTINDGLSQSSAMCMVQDDINTLWVGTQDGLNRYDGHSFETFNSADTKGMGCDYIRCAIKARNDVLWFGANGGLLRYDLKKETFETYKGSESSSLQINDLIEDDKGFIWVSTVDRGVFRFNPKTKKFQSFSKVISSKETSNLCAVDGDIIVTADDAGMFVYNPETGYSKNIPLTYENDKLHVNTLRKWNDKSLLLATNRGVYTIGLDRFNLNEKIPNIRIGDAPINVSDAIYDNNEWIVATKGYGLIIAKPDGSYKQYTEDIFQKNALLINELNTIFKDNSGNIWFGSQRGLSNFNPSYVGILGYGPSGDSTKGIPTPNVWSFAESKDGRYTYIGTDRAISRWDRKTGVYRQYYRNKEQSTAGTGEMVVLGIHVISKNRLLVACGDGVFELSISTDGYTYTQVQEKGAESSLEHKRAYSIIPWRGSKCFITTKDGVLLYDYNAKTIEKFEHDPNRKNETISEGICRVAYVDRNGQVWFATSSGGLNQLKEKDGEVQIVPYKYNDKIFKGSRDYITSMYEDADGNLWLPTLGSGLMRWNEAQGKVELFNRKHGIPNDVIYGVVSDRQGKLWLSTNKGLCSFDLSTKKVDVYTEQQGLMSNEFNLGAFMKGKNGLLYFGGIYGYNYFDPSQLGRDDSDIKVRFSKFKLENEWLTPFTKNSPLTRPIFESSDLQLDYRQNSFTLRFQPSDISNPEIMTYKYHLIGSDEGEIFLGSLNEIHFNALASGDYQLLIYARKGSGPWSSIPARLNIHINAPFWRTWWFWLLIVAMVGVIVSLFIRRRMNGAKREQIRLEIKVNNRTKEIQQQNHKIAAQKLKIEEERNKVVKQQKLLQIEKDKTEKLLKNVIPESTAEELKKRGKASARAYKTVSVLFTDFVGFTKISDRMSATELVKKLDVYFTKFDEIIVKNNLEKIKTIGDAYMCAGGVPVRNNTNPIDTCVAALQIQDYMLTLKNDAIANGMEYWELRLGINTGEVTAGVIGSERLAYDVWGATVNQAQRMEMLGAPGKVTVTGATYQYLEPYFECTFKGKAQTKSRGLIDMYEVDRIKPELSVNGEGILPNSRFKEIVNLHLYSSINYYKAERYIMQLLDKELSPALHYHSVGHSRDVVTAVERIALLENVTDEGLFLLKSAANYHDAGFIEQYDANEPVGARMAGEILPNFGYTPEHIEKIKELIFATRIPHDPKNHLEEIICDADLDYLGRDDFHEIADRLRRELREHGKIDSDRQWDEIQVGFLKMHKYFTKTAIDTRRAKKMQHLKEIEEKLELNEYKD